MPVLESPIKIPMKLEVTPDGIKMGLGNTVMPRTVIVDDELSLESENPVQNKVITAALNEKVDSEGAAAAAPVQSVSGKTGDVELVKSDVGLGNVDNTSDLDKPVSTAQAQALDGKLSKTGGSMTGPIAMGGNKITGLQQGTADADAVNVAQMASAISQGAAYFRGSFATKADLMAVAWQTSDPEAANYVTNNDYAIVLADETHSNECWRYLYVSGDGWTAQYRINESPFTQAQLDAINSGATQALISAIPGKQDALTFDTEPTYNSTNPVTSDGIHVALDEKTTYDDLYGVYPLMYSAGSENEFNDGADDIPFKSFKVTINPVQNGSGIPSPTNVRAISGWTEVMVYHETEVPGNDYTEYIIDLAPYVPGGVVYSGVLDLINWKLTVDRVAVDLGSLSWSKTGTKFYHPWDSEDPLRPDANLTPSPVGKAANALCSQYEASSYTALATKDYGFTLYRTLGTSRVYVTDSRYSTTDAFKAGVNGVTLVYPLATPIIYDISDYNYEFKSAYGLNIITATTGDNEVEYRAALELILAKTDQNFASVEPIKRASKNYSSGDLIVVQHRLYRAISSIANKQLLVPGLNISETNIETEIINSNEFTKVEYGASYSDIGVAVTHSQRFSKPVVYYDGGFCYFLTDYDNTEDAYVFTWSGKDDIAFWKCNSESVWSKDSRPIGTYSKPDTGIPKTDLDSSVQSSLDKADSAYQKPSSGIPKTDLASGVQSSLDLADSAYQKPSGGIPATDLASGVIPTVPSASSATPQDLGTAAAGSSSNYARADHVHNKPTYSKSDVGLGNVDNVQQYSASNPPPYPVFSVNGQTGAVTIAVPTKTSDLQNDSGFIAPSETPSAGQVLMYNNGAWEPMWQEKSLQLPYQLIPLSFDGTNVSTTITPRDIAEGYTFDGVDYPPYLRSSLTKADLLGSTILLTPVYGNTDGYEFQSGIFDLTSFGFAGLNGLLHIETHNGYSSPYQCTLVTWPANYPTPADIGAIPDPGGSNNGQVLAYSNGTWAADDLNTILNNEDALQIFITVNNGVHHIDADIATIAGAYLSCRKVLFLGVDNGIVMAFEPVEIDQNTGMMVLASIGGVYNYQRLTFYPNLVDGGMDGTLELIPTGADKITTPESPQSGDVLTFNGTTWVASAPVKELPTVSASDNGKVLRVVNGAWAAATVPNANGVSF